MSFVHEDHWFQFVTSALYFASSLGFFTRGNLPRYLRFILAFAFLWLSFDELMMFHECMKVSLFRGIFSSHFRDFLPLVYLIMGGAGALYFVRYYFRTRLELLAIMASAIFGCIVVAGDVFGLLPRQIGSEVEEVSELVIGILCLLISLQGARDYKNRFFEKILIYSGLVMSIYFFFLLTRLFLCPNLCT